MSLYLYVIFDPTYHEIFSNFPSEIEMHINYIFFGTVLTGARNWLFRQIVFTVCPSCHHLAVVEQAASHHLDDPVGDHRDVPASLELFRCAPLPYRIKISESKWFSEF